MISLEIEIPFKSFRAGGFPVPVATPVFSIGAQKIQVNCIVDSGADFTTIPMSIGHALGINFTKLAPKELSKKWEDLNGSDSAQMNILMKEIVEKRVAVPTTYECACGNITAAFYYPVNFELGELKKELIVLWTPHAVPPLLGRIGIFDSITELCFKKGATTVFKF